MRNRAFTTRYPGRVRVILTKVGVFLPLTEEEAKAQTPQINECMAIWDTGATHSGITKKVADNLGLRPTGIAEVRHANGKSLTNTYLVNISLPNGVTVSQIRVTEVQLLPDPNIPEEKQPQVLIGMDIIAMGDFAITNSGQKTTLSFRTPPHKEIDFIPEADEQNIQETGRNRHERRAMKASVRKSY